MALNGADEGLLGRILSHKPKSVTAVTYKQYDYAPERRAALEAWSELLRRIL